MAGDPAGRGRDYAAAAVLALAAAAVIWFGWRHPRGWLDAGAALSAGVWATGLIIVWESVGGKLFKDAQRGAWRRGPVKTPDGMRLGRP
ncbi:hypothetical protein Rhe02_36830 [Rhizocola hellebori]|uniref:Uncharacterized protein n=1 Tax=Rhizocola hellebori TaxID=1392758 RepID=A0A8J3Q9J4_9ACTN|nr:hypothetical protein [Rhizocola hellebori]GIH05616.1 hypothetical protein Rhe02_36830 [Rhizocola hellebori]